MKLPSRRNIINGLGSQIGWFSCILGAAHGNWWFGPVVVSAYLIVHFLLLERRQFKGEVLFLSISSLLGVVVDSLKKTTGLIVYSADSSDYLAPVWIVAMWTLFASTFGASMAWIQGRVIAAALLGAIFGPTSYIAGMRFGAVKFGFSLMLTIAVLSLVWASVMGGLAWLSARLLVKEEHG